MQVITVCVNNQIGIRARPATIFVSEASKFQSSIQLRSNQRLVNGKSLLGVLSANILGGSTIMIYFEGPDEIKAKNKIISLIENGFENY